MLRQTCGFKFFSTAQGARKFTNFGATIAATGGRDNGYCASLGTNNANFYYTIGSTLDSQQTWILGFWVKPNGTAFPAAPFYFVKFEDSGTIQVQFGLNADGTVTAYRGTNSLGSTTAALTSGDEYYLEFKVKIHDSTGTVDIYFNGVSALSLSGQDTQVSANASADRWTVGQFYQSTGGGTTYISDVYVADGQAGQVTDVLGPQRVDGYVLTADGALTDYTPSTGGDRYSLIDENPANDDTDYITGDIGQAFTVKTCSMGFTPGTINGVTLNSTVKKLNTNILTLKGRIRSGSSNYDSTGSMTGLATSYKLPGVVFEQNPADSAAFEQADIESGLEFGLVAS